MNYLW